MRVCPEKGLESQADHRLWIFMRSGVPSILIILSFFSLGVLKLASTQLQQPLPYLTLPTLLAYLTGLSVLLPNILGVMSAS